MTEDTNVTRLIPTKSDAEVAADFKRRMVEVYEPVLRLVDEIRAAGFEPGIQSGVGPLGKEVIARLSITKSY